MANNISSDILLKALSDKALSTLGNALAPLDAFSTDFSDQLSNRGNYITVPLITTAGGYLTNPSSFAVQNATLSACNISLDHISVPFGLTSADIQSGRKVSMLVEKAAMELAEGIKEKINALVTTAFTATALTATQANFAVSTSQSMWAGLPSGKKSLILDNLAFSKLLPSSLTSFQGNANVLPKAYGYEAIYADSELTGIGYSNCYGFAATPAAFAMASRVPTLPQGLSAVYQSTTITLENGLTVAINMWSDANTRSEYCSLDVLFGAARGDTRALVPVVSA